MKLLIIISLIKLNNSINLTINNTLIMTTKNANNSTNANHIHKVLKIFYESRDKFPNLLDVSFNILLVMMGIRKATLIEYADFINNKSQWHTLKTWIKKTFNTYNELNIMILDEQLENMIKGHQPRYLVFHSDHFREAKVAIYDMNIAMGKILGFHQAGCLGCLWSLSFFLNIGEDKVQFYAETCKTEPSLDFIDVQLKKFSEGAKLIGATIESDIRYRPSNIELVKNLDKIDEPNMEFFVKHKEAFANAMWNYSLDITTDLICKATRDEFKTLLQTYHKLWQFIIFREIHTGMFLSKDVKSEKIIEVIFYSRSPDSEPTTHTQNNIDSKSWNEILKIMQIVKNHDIHTWRYLSILTEVLPAREVITCISQAYECIQILSQSVF